MIIKKTSCMCRRERTGSCSSRHVMQLGLARMYKDSARKDLILLRIFSAFEQSNRWRNWGDCSLLQGDHGRQPLVRFELYTDWGPSHHFELFWTCHQKNGSNTAQCHGYRWLFLTRKPQVEKRTWAYWGSPMSEHPNEKDGQPRTGCDFIRGECTWADCDTGRAEVRSEQIASALWGPVVESSWLAAHRWPRRFAHILSFFTFQFAHDGFSDKLADFALKLPRKHLEVLRNGYIIHTCPNQW